MTSEYYLACASCPFERTVEGIEEALDVAETQQGRESADHFVDVFTCAERVMDE